MNNENGVTLKDITSERFCIPLYQRLFAWTPKVVSKLLRDLKEHFESDRFKKEHNPYYLGMLTTIQRDGHIDLIDGQQRFTVMILMAIVFKDIPEWSNFLLDGKRLILSARTEDEKYLEALAHERPHATYENTCMKDAIQGIQDFLKSEFDGDPDQISDFAHNIYNHLTFFISELPAHYLNDATSLNRYFEVLNSTGKGLEQHEILKVTLLKNQEEAEEFVKIWNWVAQMERPIYNRTDATSDEEYANKYRQALTNCRNNNFESVINGIQIANDTQEDAPTIDIIPVRKKEKTNAINLTEKEDSIITFPEFLLLVLDLTENCDGRDSFYQKDKLLNTFKGHRIKDMKRFYHNLLFYRLLLDYYVVRKDISNGQSRFSINFRDTDAAKREYREQMRQYMSMLTVSTEFHIWLKPYMQYLHGLTNDWKITSQEIIAKLKETDNAYRIQKGYHPSDLRELRYPNISRYWFWRLDYYLWERRKDLFNKEDQRVVETYVFRTNRSIEHLHPQDESYNDTWNEDITNGFGNLAMISQSFNSQQSNDNVRVKFARIQEQIDNKSLQSIKLLKMFRMAEDDHTKWNEGLAEEHLDDMCKILNDSFHQKE